MDKDLQAMKEGVLRIKRYFDARDFTGLDFKEEAETIHTEVLDMVVMANDEQTKGMDKEKVIQRAEFLGALALDGWVKWIVSKNDAFKSSSPGGLMQRVWTTLIKKRKDYGNAPLLRFGLWGFVVRLDAKLERLKNLLGRKEDPENEPLEDTWLDIIGYSTLMIAYAQGALK